MNIDELMQSNTYLRKEDFPTPALLTISGAEMGEIEGEKKLNLFFNEIEKALACNKTNLQLMAHFFGSTDTDDWTGHKLVAYNEPTIMYAGKMVGGIRVRLPKGVEPIQPAPAREPGSDDFDDDVPF